MAGQGRKEKAFRFSSLLIELQAARVGLGALAEGDYFEDIIRFSEYFRAGLHNERRDVGMCNAREGRTGNTKSRTLRAAVCGKRSAANVLERQEKGPTGKPKKRLNGRNAKQFVSVPDAATLYTPSGLPVLVAQDSNCYGDT
ncbi:hypothetical protein ZHAS_00004155 [Anopheles sinensis]|uniref:Uncharacterized protein n=1 Tax=Anopheles sinensis TaxID=74873 RepID=A0A084VG64_ANOSI|nr:hypothetical protein ZHAS_00004155 [Anopheles sinensis]